MNLCRTAVCLVSAMTAIVSAKADSPRYDVYLLCGMAEVTAANGGYAIVETKGSRTMRGAAFKLLRGGKLKLLADAIVNDLEMPDAADALDLNGHTLTIRSMKHRDRTGWKGTVVDSAGDGQVV